ncbi:MAG: TIM barrel protein [Andreesenia angusta]|nr:TIM barrel protein [Andreesenia angusta]
MNSQIGISVRDLNPDYIINKGFKRAQICQAVTRSAALLDIIKMTRNNDIKVGYHLPIYHQSNPKDTFYMSKNFRLRNANFEVLEANLNMIRGFNVDYAVIHFLSEQMSTEVYNDLDEFLDIARKSLNRLNILAKEYDITINIEYSALFLDYSSPKHWIEMISEYENIGLCLDIGELYFRSKERKRDFYLELEMMLQHINMIHLYNTRNREDLNKFGYIPINKDQRPENGWIDIEKVISYINSSEREIPMILDPNFSYKGREYFDDGLNWLINMLKK